MKRINGFLIAVQFLTLFPLRPGIMDEAEIKKAVSWFVVVGFLQGLLLGITDFLVGMVFHQDLVLGLVLGVYLFSNGGFHLDGLADTMDGLAIKSSGNRKEDISKRLSVMKDPVLGYAGVTAIVFCLGLKYLLLKNISHLTYSAYYSAILFMPMTSKWAMLMAMFNTKPARPDGLGRLFIGKISLKDIIYSMISFLGIAIIFTMIFKRYFSEYQFFFYPALLAGIYVLIRGLIRIFDKRFNGLTGDNLGAISELSEIMFLFMVIIWQRLFIS